MADSISDDEIEAARTKGERKQRHGKERKRETREKGSYKENELYICRCMDELTHGKHRQTDMQIDRWTG